MSKKTAKFGTPFTGIRKRLVDSQWQVKTINQAEKAGWDSDKINKLAEKIARDRETY